MVASPPSSSSASPKARGGRPDRQARGERHDDHEREAADELAHRDAVATGPGKQAEHRWTGESRDHERADQCAECQRGAPAGERDHAHGGDLSGGNAERQDAVGDGAVKWLAGRPSERNQQRKRRQHQRRDLRLAGPHLRELGRRDRQRREQHQRPENHVRAFGHQRRRSHQRQRGGGRAERQQEVGCADQPAA